MKHPTHRPQSCTCRTAYLREVRKGDVFTTGPMSPEYVATGDAETFRPFRWMKVDRVRIPMTLRGEPGQLTGTYWDRAVIETDCPHRCGGGYVPEVS